MDLGLETCKTMAGAYVAETLQWRGNCLDYMNSRFGARRTFELIRLHAGVVQNVDGVAVNYPDYSSGEVGS